MESKCSQPKTILQLMCVVNQMHRIPAPVDAFVPGMSVPQLATISYMAFQKEADVYQKDLEAVFQLRRSTLSSMLSTMEKKGLLHRESVDRDGRLKKILLTQKGKEMEEAVLSTFSKINDIMTCGLSEEELTVLSSILSKMEHNLSEAERK